MGADLHSSETPDLLVTPEQVFYLVDHLAALTHVDPPEVVFDLEWTRLPHDQRYWGQHLSMPDGPIHVRSILRFPHEFKQHMIEQVCHEFAHHVLFVRYAAGGPEQDVSHGSEHHELTEELLRFARWYAVSELGVLPVEKTGRNDPCPCGSGKKSKICDHPHPSTHYRWST